MNEILEFKGPFYFLSNFYESPFELDGHIYATVEHWFQASKAVLIDDQIRIRNAETPRIARQIGKTVSIVENWDQVRQSVMLRGIEAKFRQNLALRENLLKTGGAHLEEGNTWGDRYWGTVDRKGGNHLGKLLMHLRRQLRHQRIGEVTRQMPDHRHASLLAFLDYMNRCVDSDRRRLVDLMFEYAHKQGIHEPFQPLEGVVLKPID